MTDRSRDGRWATWVDEPEDPDEPDRWIVGWLPWDDAEPERPVAILHTQREAQLVRDVLLRLDAEPA